MIGAKVGTSKVAALANLAIVTPREHMKIVTPVAHVSAKQDTKD